MYQIILTGTSLETGKEIAKVASKGNYWNDFTTSLYHNLKHPLAILLAQIITILIVARFFGFLFKKIGQPSVIGEIIAGIILGPSLVGTYFPEFFHALFPIASLGNLQFLSQIGLILFMFVIGMELDLNVLKNKAHDAVVISHASIIFPFTLGMVLAYFIYDEFAPAGVPFLAFALFIGISMSITAFPVLARIVQERGINKTRLGTIAITCAAADDITAWCILAAVIAIVKAGSFVSALYIIVLAVLYVLLMLKVVRPFLKRIGELYPSREKLTKPIVAIFILTLIISAYCSEVIGIHALFGAFMAGAIMPEKVKFRELFIEKVEDVALVLLLPLFFVFTGLRTEIGLLNDWRLWGIAAIIIAVAVTGKFFGSALAAKIVGQNWKDSLSIGALMNTRGLMELVVLNIGFDLGILSAEIFAMLVVMALVTTFMTGPALDLINWLFRSKNNSANELIEHSKYRVLLNLNDKNQKPSLLRVANSLVHEMKGNASVTALHLKPTNEVHVFSAEFVENETFESVLQEAKSLGVGLETLFRSSVDVDADLADEANKGNYDLLLIGLNGSIFEGSLLGKVLGFTSRMINPDRIINTLSGKEKLFENSPFDASTRQIIQKCQVPVGVLVDKHVDKIENVFLPIFGREDEFLIQYAQKMIHNVGARISILDATNYIKHNDSLRAYIQFIEQHAPQQIEMLSERKITPTVLAHHDLMLISMESWEKLVNTQSIWLNSSPSILVVKNGR